MDDDAGDEEAQNPPFTRRWTTTSSYDVYMVDTPKNDSGDDKENLAKEDPPKTQPKRRCQRRRSKSCRSRDNNTGIGDDNTPDGAEDTEEPDEQTAERDNRESGHVSPDEQAIEEDPEDDSYRPPSEEETSLGNKDFIVPEDPLEQERFKLQLIATARSLKKKQ